MWRGVSSGLQTLRQGLRRRIGSGSSVDLWDDIWCGDSILGKHFHGNVDTCDEGLKVADVREALG